MSNTKIWWQSRTLWVNAVAMMFALLGVLNLLPTGIDQDQVVTAIMAVIALVNVGLRLSTRHAIM